MAMLKMLMVIALPKVMLECDLFGLRIHQPKLLSAKILIIFVPVYAIAYFSENMVYVLPALAVGVFFGTSLNQNSKKDDSEMDAETNDA